MKDLDPMDRLVRLSKLSGRARLRLQRLRQRRSERVCHHDWEAVALLDVRIWVVEARALRWSREASLCERRERRLYRALVRTERRVN